MLRPGCVAWAVRGAVRRWVPESTKFCRRVKGRSAVRTPGGRPWWLRWEKCRDAHSTNANKAKNNPLWLSQRQPWAGVMAGPLTAVS